MIAAAPAPAAARASESASLRPPRRAGDALPLGIVLAFPLAATLAGLPYYLLARAERLRDPLHGLLKPSAGIGLAFGIAALALFLFMWLYPVRKQARWLAFTGSVANWLRVHVIAGLSLPFVAAVHAGWRFEGLIGLGYLAMLLVCLSGLIGRYLYVRIPRSRSGLELSLDEAQNERRALLTRIAAETGLDPAQIERSLVAHSGPQPVAGLFRTFVRLLADDLARGAAIRALRREWERPRPGRPPVDRRAVGRALRLARRELGLRQQLHMLEATRRVFAFWHVAHRPVAITALLAVLIHVTVALLLGSVSLGPATP